MGQVQFTWGPFLLSWFILAQWFQRRRWRHESYQRGDGQCM